MIPTKEQYEEHHRIHKEIWDNRAKGVADDRLCQACILDDFHSDSSEERWCRHCPIKMVWCNRQDSYHTKYADEAARRKTKRKYAALIRDAEWLPYEEWVKKVERRS